MDIQHKLELIQQMHREQEEHERYIYYNKKYQEPELKTSWFASFQFRLLVSILLFLCFFVIDKKEIVYGEINSSNIVNHINDNIGMEEVAAYFKIEVD